MYGAILGDIVGSPYEFDCNNYKAKDFPLFSQQSEFTDDTVMTLAVAKALMDTRGQDDAAIKAALVREMQRLGCTYPDRGYGVRFGGWLYEDAPKPYNSYGNGSAMRVSPCAWIMDCGFCARTGMWPSNGRARVQLSAEVTHNHPEGVKGAMATADAIRNAISLGGDSDTLAAITGSIAEAFYGVPEELRHECRKRLPPELAAILRRWESALYNEKICGRI